MAWVQFLNTAKRAVHIRTEHITHVVGETDTQTAIHLVSSGDGDNKGNLSPSIVRVSEKCDDVIKKIKAA